jgi:hypothetical protein
MCVPCAKEVINNGFTQAAETAALVRKLSLQKVVEIEEERDDHLYAMACAEIEAIMAVKKSAVRMAKMQGTPERWLALMALL